MTINSRKSLGGLTILEVLVVIFSLSVLASLLIPAAVSAKKKASRIQCANNLVQIGLAFRIWEGDHQDKSPASLSIPNSTGIIVPSDAEDIFQVMSNELSTPHILVCPADHACQIATNFDVPLTASSLSYFANLDASDVIPQDILSGDDNFEIRDATVKSGLITLSSNTPIAWSLDRHKSCGVLLLADGSSQSADNATLASWLWWTNHAAIRLSIP